MPSDPEEDPLDVGDVGEQAVDDGDAGDQAVDDVGDQATSDHCGCGSPSCSPNVSDHEGNDYDAYETPDTE